MAATACAGPSSTAPSGFGEACPTGPRLGGTAKLGVSDDGLVSGIDDLTVSLGGSTTGACVGAASRIDDR